MRLRDQQHDSQAPEARVRPEITRWKVVHLNSRNQSLRNEMADTGTVGTSDGKVLGFESTTSLMTC